MSQNPPLHNGSRHRKALRTITALRCPKASQEQTTTRAEIRLAMLLLETWSSAGNQTSRMWSLMAIAHSSCSLRTPRFQATVPYAQRQEPCASTSSALVALDTISHCHTSAALLYISHAVHCSCMHMLYISPGKPYIHYISVDLPLKKHTLYACTYAAPTAAPACFGTHLKITGSGVSFHH